MPRKTEEYHEALTFAGEEPDVAQLALCYKETVSDISPYLEQSLRSYNDRHEIWPGKSGDHRKHGPAAFPWEGASDLETRIVEDKLRTYVAILTEAMFRSHIQAYPVEIGDTARARLTSSFLKYMAHSWIDGFARTIEQSANHFLEKGLMVSYIGWEKRKKRKPVPLSVDVLEQQFPGIGDMIADEANDAALASMLAGMVKEAGMTITEKRAKRAVRELRSSGTTTLPLAVVAIDRPCIHACRPDADVLFPSWCIDPKRAPFAFYRDFMTPQEILGRVQTDGWDADWADYVIEHHLGDNTEMLDGFEHQGRGSRIGRWEAIETDLVEVVHMFQRLVDDDDGAEGIYRTVFHPRYAPNPGENGPRAWAARDLLSDLDEFPFVVTEMSCDEKRIYEVSTLPDLIRSAQWNVKKGRDARIDGNSLRTLPEMHHPAGRPPNDRGPGRLIGYRRRDEYYYGQGPQINPDEVEMDAHLMKQIDRVVGLDPEDPDSLTKKGYYIKKFLGHQRDCLAMAYEFFQHYGPEEKFFRVVGLPEQMKMIKVEDESLDITVDFDTLHTDPDTSERAYRLMLELLPYDQEGRMSTGELVTAIAGSISPTLAARIMQPGNEGAQKLLEQFTIDWAKMASGIPVDAPPNGAAVILPAMQTLQQQPDVVEKLQENEAWMNRVSNYVKQLQFQQQQVQNAETGRRGAPAAPIQLNQAPFPAKQNGRPAAARPV